MCIVRINPINNINFTSKLSPFLNGKSSDASRDAWPEFIEEAEREGLLPQVTICLEAIANDGCDKILALEDLSGVHKARYDLRLYDNVENLLQDRIEDNGNDYGRRITITKWPNSNYREDCDSSCKYTEYGVSMPNAILAILREITNKSSYHYRKLYQSENSIEKYLSKFRVKI